MQAVDRHGRDWVSVSRDVGSKTNKQCKYKICSEVAAGRMQEPVGKPVRPKSSWSQTEHLKLMQAVDHSSSDGSASCPAESPRSVSVALALEQLTRDRSLSVSTIQANGSSRRS